MKKVFYTIMFTAVSLFLLPSCDKNEPPVFSDSNAFVAFDSPTASIEEAVPALPSETTFENMGFLPQPKHLLIPVTLGSVKGIEETVKFTVYETDEDGVILYKDYKDPEGNLEDPANWIDKTAHAGVNYNLITTSGTLTFNAENRTQYIEVEVIYNPEYTGDFKFDIELSKPESVALGFNKRCTVTITDVNHPLTPLLGDYLATTTGKDSYIWVKYSGSWTMSLYKDETDDHMVWFFNLFGNPGWAIQETMYYGNVDAEMKTIKIPFGQTMKYTYSGSPITLWYLKDDDSIGKTGSVTVEILKDDDGKVIGLDFGKEYGFLPSIDSFSDPDPLTGGAYISWLYPQITAAKQ